MAKRKAATTVQPVQPKKARQDNEQSTLVPAVKVSKPQNSPQINPTPRDSACFYGKIPFLYQEGYTLIATSHIPDPPFGGHYSVPEVRIDKNRETRSQLELCLKLPLIAGTIDCQSKCHLKVVGELHTRPQRGAQVVLVDHGGQRMVAKIYDPLYYCFIDDYRDWKLDVVQNATSEYTIEAAAYQRLQELREHEKIKFEGNITPVYYGSWTFDIPVVHKGKTFSRSVHMILLEYVEGYCMRSLDARKYPRQARDEVMVKIIELESELYFAGISHMDFSPRNIILCPPPTSVDSSPKSDRSTSSLDLQSSADSRLTNENLMDSDLRVCFIDFGSSIVHCRIPEWNYPRDRISPITRWWGVKMTDFRDTEWLPPHREASAWLWKTWKDHEDYVPAVMDPKSKVGRPVEYWDGKYSNDHVDLDMESDVEDEVYSEDEIDSDEEMDVKDEVDVKGGVDVKDGVDFEEEA